MNVALDNQAQIKSFIRDANLILKIPTPKKYNKLVLAEHPFDAQLLSVSSLYRISRQYFYDSGGTFIPKVCSTMRSLSAHDLFSDTIDYTPILTELMWFKDFAYEVTDPEAELAALMRFNDISLYHEQNHRVLWRLLPPAPQQKEELRRYLNFAESLVVTLDIALGDEVGYARSGLFEGMNLIYRPNDGSKWSQKSKAEYRQYLLAMFYSTYLALELIHSDDILKAVDYVLPKQSKINKSAVNRSLELNEQFTRITNLQWQERYWKSAAEKLKKRHAKSKQPVLQLPNDPLDFENEFEIVLKILDHYKL